MICENCGDDFEFDWDDEKRDRAVCRECLSSKE